MMHLDPPIKPEWFYSNEKEKTKINWFCFEYALELYTAIMKSSALKRYKAITKPENIADFCTYLALRMKKSVYDRLSGATDAVIMDEEYIESYYPEHTQHQNMKIMNVAFEAWDSLVAICETCPTRCISERERKSEFFDEYR